MQRASLDFGFREELLRPAAAWRQTPLNLTVTCRNRVSRWSWQHWFGILGVQGYFCVSLMSVMIVLVRRCQLVGLWCKVSVTPDGDSARREPGKGYCDSRDGGTCVGTGHWSILCPCWWDVWGESQSSRMFCIQAERSGQRLRSWRVNSTYWGLLKVSASNETGSIRCKFNRWKIRRASL